MDEGAEGSKTLLIRINNEGDGWIGQRVGKRLCEVMQKLGQCGEMW